MTPKVDTETRNNVLETVCSSERLPTTPGVAVRVISLCGDPDVSLSGLASCISADTALTAKLLRTANSSLFAGRSKITSVHGAIVRLGLKVTRVATLAFSLATEIQRKPPTDFDIERFWRHALTTASAARILAEAIRLPGADDAFADGLLQDVGVLAFQCALPEEYAKVLEEQQAQPVKELYRIEAEKIGVTHMEVGSRLLSNWHIPSEIYEPIRYHHCPDDAKWNGHAAHTMAMARILCLGAFIARLFNDPAKGVMKETVTHMAGRQFKLSEQTVTSMLENVGNAVHEMASVFGVDPATMPAYPDIQAQAGREIAQIVAGMGAETCRHEAEATRSAEQLRQLTADNEALREKAAYDGLTGVLARAEFMQRFEAELARARRHRLGVALLLLDLDRLKSVNDTFGHQAGDVILQSLAKYISQSIRESDSVGRYGGDEFIVLLVQPEVESTWEAAERLRMGIAETSKEWREDLCSVTVSIGAVCARSISENTSTSSLLAAADKSLYSAKAAGRNRTHYASTTCSES